ncbi:hypothetical protein FF38_02382 [Lucilia cuprina]|uniref:Protein TsetseEP domain-containing protein n=1 Tax=Lucilia cuprina TaxID=7375 RepID=A0A0L0CAQ9_LUCCU|nr:hypothetical protein CVS40_9450 [Lucilia cuprina]KNC29337.1 hypothetical protein FF38_02382 [Lucilia cuprina]
MLKYLLKTFIIFALFFNVYCKDYKLFSENKIADILLKNSSLISASPQRSMECFSIYIPKLNELTKNYEADYEICLQHSTEDRAIVDLEVQRDRRDLERSTEQVCAKFQACSKNNKSAYEFFECFGNVAGESTKAAYNVQNIAKDKMDYIKMKYELIEYNQNRCTDDCSRTYVEESSKIYEELEKCLAGLTL